ncbi:putative uncharacterized protein [Coraliomargarita sp. CAG:312]|nr:putative uncharacterized protein [Coraliomargarita sp. CAG:312]
MTKMTIGGYFAIIVSAALLICGAAAFAFSRRQMRDYEKLARTSTFHCMRCDSVYTASSQVQSQPCPKCGYKNARLKF